MAAKLPVFQTIGKSFAASVVELYKSMVFSLIIDLFWLIGFMPLLIVAFFGLHQIKNPPGDILQAVIGFLWFFCIWNSLVAGPLLTVVYAVYQERKLEYLSLKMFGQMFKKYYWRSVGINGVFSVAAGLLFLNIIVALYFTNFIFLIAGIISFYCLLFIMTMSFYFNPLLYLGNSFKKVLRKSFLLTLDNLLISLGFILVLGIILAVFIIIPVLLFLLFLIYGPLLVYFTDRGFEKVFGQYDL